MRRSEAPRAACVFSAIGKLSLADSARPTAARLPEASLWPTEPDLRHAALMPPRQSYALG